MSHWYALIPLAMLVVGIVTGVRNPKGGQMADNPDRQAAVRRQELRRSNAAVPIPAGQHKRPRSRAKQELRNEWQR